MEPITSEHPVVHLAKARELLILEAIGHMPPGAKKQRAHMLQELEDIIDATVSGAMAASHQPQIADPVSWDAWAYVQQRMSNAIAVPAMPSSGYAHLQTRFDRLHALSQCGEILEWIQQTHALPAVSDVALDEAITSISVFVHRLLAAPQMKEWLAEAGKETQGNAEAAGNLALMRQRWMESAGMEEALVAELSRACSTSFATWEEAKPASDFEGWLPSFEEVLRLVRLKAKALGAVFHVSDYQAMLGLSSFNPGLQNETVNTVFGSLRKRLPGLVKDVIAAQSSLPAPAPLPEVPVEAQRRVASRVMQALGLDEHHARLDESAHPFSCGERDDVRITTHYNPHDLLQAVMGVIHETGHALYSRGLPEKWRGQPLGDAQSMWVHESQSLFWEMQIASGRPFMEFLSGLIREELDSQDSVWGAQNLYRLATHVQPTLIRTDADEVTYPAHVILRHDLEQRLIAGTLEAKDLPAAWARAMREMLGVEVPDHRHGCMQDVHWPTGMIGYFPAYTFGALAAAQLMQSARKALPDMDAHIRSGNFAPIHQWLENNIYQYGARYGGEELIAKATGKPLSEQAWLDHIQARYLA